MPAVDEAPWMLHRCRDLGTLWLTLLVPTLPVSFLLACVEGHVNALLMGAVRRVVRKEKG